MRNRVLIGVLVVAAACGSEMADAPEMGAKADPTPASTMAGAAAMPPSAATDGMISKDETWSDGKMIAGNVDIAAGAKVEIAPGATLTVASGAVITVHGSLSASAKDKHAKLSGKGWMGIVVATGGSLALSGVDIDGAKETIHVNSDNKLAEYNYGTVSDGLFRIDAGGTLTVDHAAVVNGGYTFVAGTLKATFVDWNAAAIALSDASANVFVADSQIKGIGGDFFTASGGQLLHVEYTTIDNTHCPFHFNTLSKFEIDHVTTGGMSGTSTSAFGLMIYNGDAGPHSISYSNFNDPKWDQTRPTAMINVMNTYIPGAMKKAGQVTFMPADASGNNAQTEPNADAHPRGTPGPG
jgi:hypothetical protein